MVADAGPVFTRKLSYEIGLEQAPIERPRAYDELLEKRPKRAAQPDAKRHREAHLLAVENFARHVTLERAAEHSFGGPAVQLEALRKTYNMLHQLVIEEGHTALHRCGHAHAVLLGQ